MGFGFFVCSKRKKCEMRLRFRASLSSRPDADVEGRTDVQSSAIFDPCDADRDGVERRVRWKQTENARVI